MLCYNSSGREVVNCMSYRTYVNEHQIFGNNEYYQEWFDFIESQGIVVSDEFTYDGYITDVMGAIKAIEQIILRKAKESEETIIGRNGKTFKHCKLFDFSNEYEKIIMDREDKYGMELTDHIMFIEDIAYMFMSVAFIKACKDLIERVPKPKGKRLYNYKVKDGKQVHVHAG